MTKNPKQMEINMDHRRNNTDRGKPRQLIEEKHQPVSFCPNKESNMA
jgi:hypothetical protein